MHTGCESSVVGHVRVGSGERFAAVARDAIGESCGEMDGKLRIFLGVARFLSCGAGFYRFSTDNCENALTTVVIMVLVSVCRRSFWQIFAISTSCLLQMVARLCDYQLD